MIDWKLTDDQIVFSTDDFPTWNDFLAREVKVDLAIKAQIDYLQILNHQPFVLKGNHTLAAQLQALLINRWKLQTEDQDLVLMHHIIEYQIENQQYTKTSTLKVKGLDSTQTAMAKTVGLPLAMSVLMILDRKIESGVILPLNTVFYDQIFRFQRI